MELKKDSECVRVVIRCRPMSEKERTEGYSSCIRSINFPKGTIEIVDPRAAKNAETRTFTFDAVYGENSKQTELYEESFSALVQSALEGFNSTIFAYGQTGTGKTYTVQGVENNEELIGLIPRAFHHIFSCIQSSQAAEFLVRASYLEIYKEEIRDLLQPDQNKRLELKEKPDIGVYVKDLSSVVTKSFTEIDKTLKLGLKNRSVGATSMNELSSRSHAIFIITIEEARMGADGKTHIRVGKLNIVDLAGSERQSKTNSQGERLKEATKINLSLSSLGNVISALVDKKSTHIPYRDSKLTRLLQNSLGGNSKTIMVANIGPASYNFEESLNTLRYANRAKSITNKPRINEDPKDALLREYQEEIERLRRQIHEQKLPRDDTKAYELCLDEQRKNFNEERERILNNESLLKEDKAKLLENLQKKKSKLMEEESNTMKLAERLKYMESKLLHGDKNIVEQTRDQEATLAARNQELAEKRAVELRMREKMQEENFNVANLQEGFSSLQQEVEVNTKKLKKLYEKYQQLKMEIEDTKEAQRHERQGQEQIQENLLRDLKLQALIIENFIPNDDKIRLNKMVYFDEQEDQWKMKPSAEQKPKTFSELTGTQPNQLYCQFALMMSKIDPDPRLKHIKLLDLDLDMPTRTTKDYQPPTLAPQVVAALEAALQNEQDLEFDAMPSVFTQKSRKK
ncbi:Kinesin-like protein kif3b [Cichlidogyrus casuarinus]|uniref:Kinesin-like protein n=1 Tax=Cichlidogyrus casuarinus TaxID=1844966 RepID=A0ABD2Q9M1_9PLAT